MNARLPTLLSVPLLSIALAAQAPPPPASPPAEGLRVAVVAEAEPASSFTATLRAAGMRVTRVAPDDFDVGSVWNAQVVLVDWPQDRAMPAAVTADVERWRHATVFTAACAARFAAAFGLPTPADIGALPTAARGPAMQPFAFEGLDGGVVWRHGHLHYLPEAATPGGRDRVLAATVARAAHFACDAPVLRAPDPERLQRQQRTAERLGVDVSSFADLETLPNRLGDEFDDVQPLLLDVLPGGPKAGSFPRVWTSYLRYKREALVWDPMSKAWPLDWLAAQRRVPSAELRGDARALGERQDADVQALVARVVANYGGAARHDLATFSCWLGDEHLMWDRRRGYLRIENHHVVPAGNRATPWKVTVHDTLADRELIWGGGPPPRPRISGRATCWKLFQLVFLPLSLDDPCVDVRLLADESTPRHAALAVRVGLPSTAQHATYVVEVERDSAKVVGLEVRDGDSVRERWEPLGTAPCGPLRLLARWRDAKSSGGREFVVDDPQWNPTLPAQLESSEELLTDPRQR